MTASLVTLAEFQDQYEKGLVNEVFSTTVNAEKRVYGRSVKGQASNPARYIIIYAVVP